VVGAVTGMFDLDFGVCFVLFGLAVSGSRFGAGSGAGAGAGAGFGAV